MNVSKAVLITGCSSGIGWDTARSPRSRYAVSPSARLFLGLRRLLPDRAWDAALRTSFPQPGR